MDKFLIFDQCGHGNSFLNANFLATGTNGTFTWFNFMLKSLITELYLCINRSDQIAICIKDTKVLNILNKTILISPLKVGFMHQNEET